MKKKVLLVEVTERITGADSWARDKVGEQFKVVRSSSQSHYYVLEDDNSVSKRVFSQSHIKTVGNLGVLEIDNPHNMPV